MPLTTPTNEQRLAQVRETRKLKEVLDGLDSVIRECTRQRPTISSSLELAESWTALNGLCAELKEGVKLLRTINHLPR